MHRLVFCLSVITTLGGCAMSSGVLLLGPDTYTVTVAASYLRGGAAGAQRMALTEAKAHCTQIGKELLVTNTSSRPSHGMAGTTTEIVFRCLSKGDPEFTRPTYREAPTTIIEDRRK